MENHQGSTIIPITDVGNRMFAIGMPFARLFSNHKDDSNFICLIEAQSACHKDVNYNHDSQKNATDHHDKQQ